MLEDLFLILTPLVGKCFVATLSPGVTDTHCFKPLYEGAHIEDRHVVIDNGKSAYEGLSIYSKTPDGLYLIYVNSTGGSGAGTAKMSETGFDYQMTMRGESGGEAKPYSGHWTVRQDGFDVSVPGEKDRTYILVR